MDLGSESVQVEMADRLERLLDSEPTEEAVHQFLKAILIGPVLSRGRVQGFLSKFPISPDRVPDFSYLNLYLFLSQVGPGAVTFIELKRPSARLYTDHARMSKDLNDAWMECLETSRLIGQNYPDVLRRVVKSATNAEVSDYVPICYQGGSWINENSGLMPRCRSVIVIGRRSYLDSEAILRTIQLGASTNSAIRVVTYDSVIENLRHGWGIFDWA